MTQKELIVAIDDWLTKKGSPIAGFADYMVILARHFGIASAVSVGVAQAESQCGTDPNYDQITLDGHNVWGYGHSPGTHGFLFSSWPDGINACTERLAQIVHAGADTVEKLGCVWVNGDWSFQHVPTQWVSVVSQIITQFGGDPNKLLKSPLAPAV